ncbi:MAG: hypothetical protein ACR2P6_00020, partial [Gammaproteobacteria bacterium]
MIFTRKLLLILLLAALSSSVFANAFKGRPLNKPIDNYGQQRALQAQERHTQSLLEREGIVGTDVSFDADGQPVIRVFISNDSVRAQIPTHLDAIPV